MNLATLLRRAADSSGSLSRCAGGLLLAALALAWPGCTVAQSPLSRPILFVHGWCGSGYDWSPFFETNALFTLLPSSLYPNQSVYLVQYDSVTNTVSYWLENDPAAGPGTTLTAVTEADIPSTARFFAINFIDPNPASTNPTDSTNVARISILNKAYEVAQVVAHIKTITSVDQVNVLAHSMGGLDARAYVENMASAGACYNYSASMPNYTAATCTPGAGNGAWTGDVANIITLDTPNAGSPLVDSSLRSYLASYGYACEGYQHYQQRGDEPREQPAAKPELRGSGAGRSVAGGPGHAGAGAGGLRIGCDAVMDGVDAATRTMWCRCRASRSRRIFPGRTQRLR